MEKNENVIEIKKMEARHNDNYSKLVEEVARMEKQHIENMNGLEQKSVVVGGYTGAGTSMLFEELKEAGAMIDKDEDVLFDDKRTLEEIIQEIADQDGMTFEETMALFRKGLKEANNYVTPVDPKKKKKARAKNKQAKKSRKKNR